VLEDSFENHIEALRHELTYQTNRAAGAIEERDAIQGRLHAIDHAYSESQKALGIAGDEIRRLQTLIQLHRHDRDTSAQDSAENVASANTDGNALMIILGALVDSQRIVTDWLVPDGIRAKKAMSKLVAVLDNERLVLAMRSFEGVAHPTSATETAGCSHRYVYFPFGSLACIDCRKPA